MFKVSDKESFAVMSVGEFFAIPDNPRQRDTERHANRAKKAHLKVASDIHKFVEVAALPDGSMLKLDGHTRAFLWQIGELESPAFVVAKIRKAKDAKEAMQMYLEYDSASAVESMQDKGSGAIRQAGITFESSLMRSGKFLSALSLAKKGVVDSKALHGDGIYDLVKEFKPQLMQIDSLHPTGERFVAGVVAAAIISLRKHDYAALSFWSAYSRGLGEKTGKEKCAVQMLEDLIKLRRAAQTLHARAHVVDVCSKALAACDKWIKGEKYTGGIKGVDVLAYVNSMK